MERKKSAASILGTGATKILINTIFFLLISSAAWASSPVIFYSDLTAGPNTGGQNNNGVFVTIWGNNFGSSQGSSYVTVGSGKVNNYPTWTNTMICFQLGSLATTGNIVVTSSNGTSNGLAFTVQSGNIYFVQPGASTNGTGTYASPFSHIYYAYNIMVPGDTVYVLAGTIADEVDGTEGFHSMLSGDDTAQGSSSGYLAFIAYPNATVTLIADGGAPTWTDGTSGNPTGDVVSYIFRDFTYTVISKFYMNDTGENPSVASVAGDISTPNSLRVIGNHITGCCVPDAGQITFNGNNMVVDGNEVYDNYGGTPGSPAYNNEFHMIYLNGPSTTSDIGWNYIHDNYDYGWSIDNYHAGPRTGIKIHDNLIIGTNLGASKGILLGDQDPGDSAPSTEWGNTYSVYNNTLVNVGYGGVNLEGDLQLVDGTGYIYNNTFWGSGTNTWSNIEFASPFLGPGGGNAQWYIADNIFYATNSATYPYLSVYTTPPTNAYSGYVALLTNNMYYGEGNGPSADAHAINANPVLINPTLDDTGSWGLQSTSPAIGAGYNTTSIVAADYNGVTRPNPPAIGAYEYTSSVSTPQPVVSITSPATGINVSTGSNVSITATASESNGTITNISLYNGSTLLGSSSSSPYTYTMTDPAIATYTLTAVATDAKSVSTTSSPVIVIVIPLSLPSSPVVNITSPASGSSYTAGSNVTITTTASETNGTISNISLYNGSGILLGTSTTSPYSYVDSNMAAGGYSFYAVAKDANGVSTTSSTITITVTSPSVPVVTMTSPANGNSFTTSSNITITATASETNGSIASVKFYDNNGTSLIHTSTTAPYTFTTTAAAGTYTLTAIATDTNGVSTTSSPVTITVTGLPTVSLAANNTTFTAPAIITLTANAAETNGTISKVEFFNGSSLLGTVTSSPYVYTWSNVAAGSYNLTAEAFDSNNNTATSTAVAVTVTIAGVAPSFTSQPVSETVTAPATATFSVAATGTPAPTFQWMQSVNGGAFANIAGATSSSYTTAATTTTNSGTQFECVVTNASGSVTSSVATLTVNPTPVAPGITTQPVSKTVTAPATATFTVAATGTPVPTYQWMQSVNGGAFTNISGATSASYTTAATTTTNSGTQFECVVTNASGSVTSNVATLTVNPAPVAPSITAQPVSEIVTAPATATFSVAATGTPAPTFQWMQSVNGGAFTSINGATSSSYTTTATTTTNNGIQFECVVTNASGNVTSSAATLTVNPAPVAPSITAQPVSMTLTAPATATFSVAATGTPAPTFQWMQSVNGGTFTNISGATGTSYTTPATTVANSGTQFECVVTNASGSVTSNAATLTVNSAPSLPTVSLTAPSNNASFAAPATVFLSANASEANGTIAQVQFFNGSTLLYTAASAPYNYTWASNLLPGSYTLTARATDSRGVVVTSAPVTINIALSLMTPPSAPVVAITSPASGSSIAAGSNLTITASASETNGTIAVVYFYNGSTFLGSSSTSPYSYTMTNVPVGSYTLTAKAVDTTGHSVTSSPIAITVTSATPVAPEPVVTITSPSNGNSFISGSNFTIMANASETAGTGTLAQEVAAIAQVQFYNGSALLGTSATSPYTLNWSNVPAGTYTLIAKATDTNGVSTTSSPVTVTVATPSLPVVALTNPVNGGSYATGSSVTISANASEINGTIAQVQFYNGSTLLGTDTTSPYSYTWSNVPAGSYTLTAKATDANGVSTTSGAITITVRTPAPVVAITSPTNGSSFTAGSNLSVTASASEINGTIAQVQFYNGSTLLGTDTTSPYSYTWSNVPAGSYTLTAKATDANGVSVTSNAVTITVATAAPSSPVVTITGPANVDTVTPGSNITFTVNASDTNDAITQVQIYNGSTLLYTTNSASFNYTWAVNLLPGSYNLTAQATNANGEVVTSAPVTIKITLPGIGGGF